MPDNDSVGLFEALLAKLRVAAAAPEVCGAKVTVNGALCPGARVSGKEIPLSANWELFVDPDEIVTLNVLALITPDWLLVAPMVTVPKAAERGVIAN